MNSRQSSRNNTWEHRWYNKDMTSPYGKTVEAFPRLGVMII
ncbi:hypothetical protein [Cesiribacter sp. SM1]|nr:hypothetical protein [Cesiribacter sp. SM1]